MRAAPWFRVARAAQLEVITATRERSAWRRRTRRNSMNVRSSSSSARVAPNSLTSRI